MQSSVLVWVWSPQTLPDFAWIFIHLPQGGNLG
jgi:hypothetical protein